MVQKPPAEVKILHSDATLLQKLLRMFIAYRLCVPETSRSADDDLKSLQVLLEAKLEGQNLLNMTPCRVRGAEVVGKLLGDPFRLRTPTT